MGNIMNWQCLPSRDAMGRPIPAYKEKQITRLETHCFAIYHFLNLTEREGKGILSGYTRAKLTIMALCSDIFISLKARRKFWNESLVKGSFPTFRTLLLLL